MACQMSRSVHIGFIWGQVIPSSQHVSAIAALNNAYVQKMKDKAKTIIYSYAGQSDDSNCI